MCFGLNMLDGGSGTGLAGSEVYGAAVEEKLPGFVAEGVGAAEIAPQVSFWSGRTSGDFL
jgi:hypothetical protein